MRKPLWSILTLVLFWCSGGAAWKESRSIGAYFDGFAPWLYHEEIGWFQSIGEFTGNEESIVFYDASFGWLWTDRSIFPNVYSLIEGWSYLYSGISEHRWLHLLEKEKMLPAVTGLEPTSEWIDEQLVQYEIIFPSFFVPVVGIFYSQDTFIWEYSGRPGMIYSSDDYLSGTVIYSQTVNELKVEMLNTESSNEDIIGHEREFNLVFITPDEGLFWCFEESLYRDGTIPCFGYFRVLE